LPQYKTDFVYQKEHQDTVPKEQKGLLNKEVGTSSLLEANKARESLKDFTVALKIKDLPILFHKHNNGVVIDQQSQSKSRLVRETLK